MPWQKADISPARVGHDGMSDAVRAAGMARDEAGLYALGGCMVMEIRRAGGRDRGQVMEICRQVCPEGDYVEDVWDAWLADGGPHVVCEDGTLIGVFNVSVRSGQGWVEGTRIHRSYRRRGAGTMVLQYAVQYVRRLGGHVIRSLIHEGNAASLERALKAGWHMGELWSWYGINPDRAGTFSRIGRRDLDDAKYVDSWRVYDLEADNENTVFFRGAAATVIPARHFPGTTLVTVLEAEDLSELASYLNTIRPDSMRMHGWSTGMHIASRVEESLFEGRFTKISSYRLMSRRV